MYEIALREPMLPSIIKTPWWKSKRIEVVYQPNIMVVYKVVPHANVAAQTQSMWKSLHKMYALYASPRSRFERDGLKFTYREKDSLWFDVVFRRRGGENKVEFYVGTTEFQAEKLKRRLENMMHVTLKDATLKDIAIPEENTVVQEMRYSRHDIFSLSTKVNERQTPIATILNTVDELVHEGDMARLSLCAVHQDRKRWADKAKYAHEQLAAGKVPQRPGIGKALPVFRNGLAGLVNSVNAVMQDVLDAIQNAFFAPDKGSERQDIIERHSLLDEIMSHKLSGATLEKKNLPVLGVHIRTAAHSKERLTRDTIVDTLSTGISDTDQDNELQAVTMRGKDTARIIKEMNEMRLSRQTRSAPNVNLISTDEMAKLALQLPNRELQMKYAHELEAKYRIEVKVPEALQTGQGIPLATATIKDRIMSVDMPTADADGFFRAYVFIGGQGAGKDTAIKNWVVDACLKKGISSIVIDAICEPGERGMADGIRDMLPEHKIIDLDLGHDEYVVPLDLTEVVTALGINGPSRFADEMIDLMGLGEHSQSRRFLREAAKASGGSLHGIMKIIQNEKFRLKTIERLMEEGNKRLADQLIEWGSNDDIGSKADPVLNRLDEFFGNDRLYDVFCQDPIPGMDFAKWMTEGKVIILRVPNRKLGETATKTLVHWITMKVFMTRMLMSKKDKSNGLFFVFNEPEQYSTPGLTKLMGRIGTEGRKERMGSLFAFHHWNKLPKHLQENLMGGGVQQFLFRNDHHDTFKLSLHRFKETVPMEQAEQLPDHYAIVSLRAARVLQPAFIAKMNPPYEMKYDNTHLTEAHAKRYGRHWKELRG